MSPLPPHLQSFQAQGAFENQPIAQYELGPHQNFIYLLLDWPSRQALWVDPQEDLAEPLQFLKNHSFKTVGILLTHTHFDHIAGVPHLLNLFPEITVHVHPHDQHRLSSAAFQKARIQGIQDGEDIHVGQLSVKVIHTPGHSAGGCCYHVQTTPPALLSGDTLFIEDCGRTDLPTGSDEELFHSLQKLKALPADTLILPGHHYRKACASTLAQEKKNNPALLCQTTQELRELS